MKDINTIDDLILGTIFKCSWGGMSDYYELIGKTPKSVKLREIRWETCAAPEGEELSDPVHRWTHICRDKNGNTIPEKDWQGYDKTLKMEELLLVHQITMAKLLYQFAQMTTQKCTGVKKNLGE